jgi:hypothetical protein
VPNPVSGEESELGPFAELGEHATGLDAQPDGEFVATPVMRRFAGARWRWLTVTLIALMAVAAWGRPSSRLR